MKFDPRPFVEHYLAENEMERRAIREQAAIALTEARRLADRMLREDPEARTVILFGSLAEEGPRRMTFDIDLALDGGDLYKALDIAEESLFDVDVVRLDRVPEHILARIKARGIILSAR